MGQNTSECVFRSGCVDTPEGMFAWQLTEDGCLTISGSGVLKWNISYHSNTGEGWDSHYDAEEEDWPWEPYREQIKKIVLGRGISALDDGVLSNYPNVEEIILPETMEDLGRNNFCRTAIRNLVLPESIISIGGFSRTPLMEVHIPEGVTYIGDEAFSHTEIREIHIPEGVTHIGNGAFSHTRIREVHIPDGVTSIGSGAFTHTEIREIHIPESVSHIGEGAFTGTLLPSEGGVMYADGWLLSYTRKDCVKYHVRPGTRGIADDVFDVSVFVPSLSCVQPADLFIPGTVKHIGSQSGYGIKRVFLGLGCPVVRAGQLGSSDTLIIRRKALIPQEDGDEPWSFSCFPETEKTYERAKSISQDPRLTKVLNLVKETALEEGWANHRCLFPYADPFPRRAKYEDWPMWQKEFSVNRLSKEGLSSMETDRSSSAVSVEFKPRKGVLCSVSLALLNHLEQLGENLPADAEAFTLVFHMPGDLTEMPGFRAIKELIAALFPWIAEILVLPTDQISRYERGFTGPDPDEQEKWQRI